MEAANIAAGLNLIDTYISKRVNLYHCKIIVLSEEIAVGDIRNIIYSLITNLEIRKDASILVTRSKAEDFIKSSKPTLEKITAKYYELAVNSENTTGFITNENIMSFYTKLNDVFIEPVAILGGVHDDSVAKVNVTHDGAYKAEEIPILNKPNTAMMGLAVFKNAKMVGELDGIETMCYLIVSNRLKNCTISIPTEISNSGKITVTLKLKRKTKNSVQMQNGSPYIICKPNLEVNIVSMEEGENYLDKEYIRQIEESINRYLEVIISKYLYKTSKEYKSDISGFGKYLVRDYLTIQEWKEVNWAEIYKDSFFNVEVKTTINNADLLVKT